MIFAFPTTNRIPIIKKKSSMAIILILKSLLNEDISGNLRLSLTK